MSNIIIIAPLNAIGGINSWSKNMRANYPETENKIFYIDNLAKTSQVTQTNKLLQKWNLISQKSFDLFKILKEVKVCISENNIKILHTTTSGGAGTFRDYLIAKLCRKRGVKTIMQCRYGQIPDVIEKRNLKANFLINTMELFDEIWVLDSKTKKALDNFDLLRNKVFLVPNTIECPNTCDTYPNSFKNIVFVASVVPTKGILELVTAIANSDLDFHLKVAGNASQAMKKEIQKIANYKNEGNWIEILGPIANSKAKELIKNADILALPTYYLAEAFPISILEAMSYGKMVVSTDRAAIPDMLKISETELCGFLVKEKDHLSLQKALEYCYNNSEEANKMCKKAFEKVKNNYTNKIVFDTYNKRYNNVLKK